MFQNIQLLGKDLKTAVKSVTCFQLAGSFAGSELVSLRAKNGVLTASTFGVVLSKARVPASGDLDLIAVDGRILGSFAPLLSDTVKVQLINDGKKLKMQAGKREAEAAVIPGQPHNLPDFKTFKSFVIDKETANRVSYLTDLSFADTSRPELNCVLLSGKGTALAVNQKCAASLKLQNNGMDRTALPILLAKVLKEKDTIYAGEKETVVKSGNAYYAMPAPIRAQAEFPADAVNSYGQMPQEVIAGCSGEHLAKAILECQACLGSLARTEIVVKVTALKDRLELSAENGGARFRTALRAQVKKESVLVAPLEELKNVAPFVLLETSVTISAGSQRGEMLLLFDSGFCIFPSWRKPK